MIYKRRQIPLQSQPAWVLPQTPGLCWSKSSNNIRLRLFFQVSGEMAIKWIILTCIFPLLSMDKRRIKLGSNTDNIGIYNLFYLLLISLNFMLN
jgi:hypothetical protein